MLTLNKPHAYKKKMYFFAGYHLGCVADLIYPRLVINFCKAMPMSLFCAFRIPFQLHWQITMAFLYNMPVMARISFYRLGSQK